MIPSDELSDFTERHTHPYNYESIKITTCNGRPFYSIWMFYNLGALMNETPCEKNAINFQGASCGGKGNNTFSILVASSGKAASTNFLSEGVILPKVEILETPLD
jgi:hypothetical protein